MSNLNTADRPPLLDKYVGCLLGQCLGDALGFPVEGFSSDACLDYLHRQVKPQWLGKRFEKTHPFGQYTDDSQLARELLLSLINCRGFDGDDYAGRLRQLFESNQVVGRGIACDSAIRRIIAGVPWQQAGCPPPRAGNGTAMRVAPIALIYAREHNLLIRYAREQGWITHRDPRCDAGSVAVALAIAQALAQDTTPAEFLQSISDAITPFAEDFGSAVLDLEQMVPEQPAIAAEWAANVGLEEGVETGWPGISPFVVSTVLWSLYCFLHSPNDYYTSIWHAIAVGGDVDTTAAITGAISGAYNGASSLPAHLLADLNDRGEWRADKLRALCDQAVKLSESFR